MSKRVVVGEAEYLSPVDYNRFGQFPQDAIDDVVSDAIGFPAHWAAFTVARRSAQEVDVSPGRFFEGRAVYAADATQTLNLTLYLPVAASDERWVALILRGETGSIQEERAFETSQDPETNELVSIPTPVIANRIVRIVVQQGLASPAPAVQPAIAETDACIAYVRLTTQGVQDIQPGDRWRVKSLYEVENRVQSMELSFVQVVVRTEVLETGMANANAAIDELRRTQIRPEIFRQVRRDVAALRIKGDVPEGARSDWYDPALVLDRWDPIHSSWLARIDEGIQMPFAAARQARLELQNEDDPRISFRQRRMVPSWKKAKRIFNEGGVATRLISQQTHIEINAVKRSVSRTKTVYGPTVNICENAAEWSRYSSDLEAGKTFSRNGETFVVIGQVADNGNTAQGYVPGHRIYAVRTVKKIKSTDTYWDYQPTELGLNGSVYGQTFLVDQPLIAPSIELEFANLGTDGAVYVLFCETGPTGAPKIADVISEAKLEFAELKLGWNEFRSDLTYFEPGKRYAWYVVTTGNHQIKGSTGNQFASGTSFRFSDGAWAQGDLDFDFNFRLNGCRFDNTRTVVNFKPMSLADGMTQFSLLYPNWEPEGTAIAVEFQPVFGGEDMPWSPLAPTGVNLDDNPLVGLPSLVNLRVTMLATPDLAPMIELSADAVYEAARVRNEFRAVSRRIVLGLTTTTIQTLTVLDDFDPAVHAFTPRIMVNDGPALIAPDVSTTTVDPDRPTRRTVVSTYTVPAGTGVVRNVPGGATTNIANVFFVQNTSLFAL